MAIDAEKYRRAREYYRQWDEVEIKERARNAGKLSSEEAWQQYCALWKFCIALNPESGKAQRYQKMRDMARYYDNIQRFEAWRAKR